MQTGIFFEDTIYFSGTAQEDVGKIKLIEEYIVSMATTVDINRWFRRSASSVCSAHNKPPDKGWYWPTDFIHMIELFHLYWCCATI